MLDVVAKSWKSLIQMQSLLIDKAVDRRLGKTIPVYRNKRKAFYVSDFGPMTRYRAKGFELKEPETIKWIESFEENDLLVDIGANIGMYSLYAASLGIQAIAIEADSLNFAMLNINIRINNMGKRIMPYCIGIHNKTGFSSLNISDLLFGGSCNSFDNCLDYKGNSFVPTHVQGLYGCSLDDFLANTGACPNHLKIDVDGNENLILNGSGYTLLQKSLKSILIELDESRSNYKSSIESLQRSGFMLVEKFVPRKNPGRSVNNHLFTRENL